MDVMESLEILWELNTPVKEKFGRRKTAATRWTDVVSFRPSSSFSSVMIF